MLTLNTSDGGYKTHHNPENARAHIAA